MLRIHILRGAACKTLTVAAVALLSCAPQTVDPGETDSTNSSMDDPAAREKVDSSISDTTNTAGSGSAGLASAQAVQPTAQASMLSVGGSGSPPAAPPSAASGGAPSVGGPTTALARIELLGQRPDAMTMTSTTTHSSAGAQAAAGSGSFRSAQHSVGTPTSEICQRVKTAIPMMSPAIANPRIRALLVACDAADQSSPGAVPAAAQGGSAASTGDVPTDDSEAEPLAGTAVFTRAEDGSASVTLLVVLQGCKDSAYYPVRIHDGRSCADRNSIGALWDSTRGDDIPDVRCSGAHAAQQYVRESIAGKAWTLGGPSTSDVVGHTFVIDDPQDRTLPIACGVITAP